MPILEIDSLHCGYGNKKVLSGLSFGVEEGEFVGIIGPNGAGKTTLFRAITRVLKPSGGKILYRGKDVFTREGIEKEVAAMSQFMEEPFSFSVEDFVMMGRFPHIKRFDEPKKKDFDVVLGALDITGTFSLRDRKINELSGGERQRVFLAQALAQEPKLLLLDEPTAHLDIGHQVEVMDLVRKLNLENKITVLAVLHDLNIAAEYCTKLVLMDSGGINMTGAPREVLTYQNIEEVYKTVVVVKDSPLTHKPHVFAVSKKDL